MKIKWYKDKQLMNVNQKNKVTWLTYPAFEKFPGIVHGFSTRLGGVSQGIYESMNLSFTRGDEESAVRVVTEEDRGNGITKPRPYTDVDGMITNVPGLVLATFYADCVPLFFIDPVHRAVGLSHSGWRGTVGKIGKVTVEKMTEEFQTDPSELYAAIGPSICQDCYEVSEDVMILARYLLIFASI